MYSKTKMMKPMNPFVESYRREADIIMPKKHDNKIKPNEIFEGLNQKKIKPKKNEKKSTSKKNKSKK